MSKLHPLPLRRRAMSLIVAAFVTTVPALAVQAQAQKPAQKPAEKPAAAAPAKGPQKLGAFTGWDAYADGTGTAKYCYLVGRPKSSAPKLAKRGDTYLLVTHRPATKTRNEVNAMFGYPLKDKSEVPATVEKAKVSLFTKDDGAWAKTADDDKALVDAMLKGATLVLQGTPKTGAAITDTYQLAGFPAAYAAIGKACP